MNWFAFPELPRTEEAARELVLRTGESIPV